MFYDSTNSDYKFSAMKTTNFKIITFQDTTNISNHNKAVNYVYVKALPQVLYEK